MRLALLLVTLFPLFLFHLCQSQVDQGQAEILWDSWGVPHISASDDVGVFFGMGWAQAQQHAPLLLRCYGESRARAAEYWGEKYLAQDIWLRTNNVVPLAAQWLSQQTPAFRKKLEAFAEGVNAWATQHRQLLTPDLQSVLPISAVDVMAHTLRVVHFQFVTSQQRVQMTMKTPKSNGSNAWAIRPERTRENHAILLANPHLPWEGFFTFFEAHVKAPGIDAYGVTLIGLPVLVIAFNDHLGWTHTVNDFDGCDLFELIPRDGGYQWDQGILPWKEKHESLLVKQIDGSFHSHGYSTKRSIHGPIVGTNNNSHSIAMRVAGLDRPGILEQWWDMARCQNLSEMETVLRRLQVPMFTVMYADRAGNIMHLFGGCTPKRPSGKFNWTGVVPGNTASTLWTSIHPFEDLPRVVNPTQGWLQNTNDPPWSTSLPPVLDRSKYPDYLSSDSINPIVLFRTLSSLRLLESLKDGLTSKQDIIELRRNTRVEAAEHLLPPLLNLLREGKDPRILEAIKVLEAWDRTTNAGSRGALLFYFIVRQLMQEQMLAIQWKISKPFEVSVSLRSPEQARKVVIEAVDQIKKKWKELDVPWGQVVRLRAEGLDLPVNGGPGEIGCFRVLDFLPDADGHFRIDFGDTYVAVVEFGQTVKAQALLSYGNASAPWSKNRYDQLPLLSRNELRPVWVERTEILNHLVKRESLKIR